jgi:recombination protein RecR
MLKDRLPTLQKLILQLQSVPYLATKNVYRVALHFLEKDEQSLDAFCKVLLEAKKNIRQCALCFNWHEGGQSCSICADGSRNKGIVCVVETWHDLLAMEKSGGYDGVYHVLGGSLCPLEGIGPEDLTIEQLITRVTSGAVQEIIFATNPTPEGEASASFIASKLKGMSIKISKLASGVPIGSTIEYMDRVTLYKALCGRRPF